MFANTSTGNIMDPITAIVGTVGTIVSRIWPDKTEADRAAINSSSSSKNCLNLKSIKKRLQMKACLFQDGGLILAGYVE
jgi:hypothetical protein